MRILVSNDDGYDAAGIAALADAMRDLGEVIVVAPERNRSGASNSLTLDRSLHVRRASNGFYYVDGTPTDCVHIAATGLLEHKPDLVVSGINNGANMGDDTIYSGTVAAAMEGYLFGLPAFAFSLTTRDWSHLDTAARVARDLVSRHCAGALPGPFLLNVNIPGVPYAALNGVRSTRLGKRHPSEPVVKGVDEQGGPAYWIGPAGAAKDSGPGTDFHALATGCVSVTPLHVDLTRAEHVPVVADWLKR